MPIPLRVLVDRGGRAVSPHLAWEEFGVRPEIIFIREDGYALGAPLELEEEAYKMWPESWAFFCRDGEQHLTPITEYKRKEQQQL